MASGDEFDKSSEQAALSSSLEEGKDSTSKEGINFEITIRNLKESAAAEAKKQTILPTEGGSGDQRAEDSYLTEEDIFQMKDLTAGRGTTSDAMRSVISLADTGSNFEERVVSEEAEESETTDVDVSVIDEKEVQQTGGVSEEVSSDSDEVLMDQGTVSGGFMFDRRRLSNPKLPDKVTKLNYPFAKKSPTDTEQQNEVLDALDAACVYLIGTAHFSSESQRDVLKTIQKTQPDLVMVELCPSRITMLSMDEETLLRESKNLTFDKIMSIIKQSGVVQGVLHVLLLSMSAHVTRELGMAPGGEFRAAYDGAMKVRQCRVVLGDRPIQITLQRALGSLSIFQKIRLFFDLLASHKSSVTFEEVERCKDSDMLEGFLKEMANEFPPLLKILVDERDMYMVNTLHTILRSTTMEKLDACRAINAKYQPVTVVAVVGIGHVPGIISNWEKRISTTELLTVPKPSKISRVIKFGFKAALVGAAVYVGYRCSVQVYNKIRGA